MPLTLTFSFILSALLLVGLFVFRAFEESRGVVYFRELRGKLDHHILRAVVSLQKLTHTTWRGTLRKVFAYLSHTVVYSALLLVRMLERRLSRIASFIRGKYASSGEGRRDGGREGKTRASASHYLKKVGRSAKEHEGEE